MARMAVLQSMKANNNNLKMKYGKLVVWAGPMFAGKTTKLLEKVVWLEHSKQNYQFLKIKFDNRYHNKEIVNHDGESFAAQVVDRTPLFKLLPNTILIDEIQFFDKNNYQGDIIHDIQKWLSWGVDVYSSGLDMDWQGNPFETTSRLLSMADEVIKLTANCSVCNLPASKTYKKVARGGSVELGSTDLYEARCNEHWLERS